MAKPVLINKLDWIEVAALLLQHLKNSFVYSKEMAQAYYEIADADNATFAQDLMNYFDEDEIHELMSIPQGPGMILGIYLNAKANDALKDQEEESDE